MLWYARSTYVANYFRTSDAILGHADEDATITMVIHVAIFTFLDAGFH